MENEAKIETYKKELCDKLNAAGFICYGEYEFKPEDFPHIKELMMYIVQKPEIYDFAVTTNLIHRNFCPLCGNSLGSNPGNWNFFGRKYFMCGNCLDKIAPQNSNKEGCYIATVCYGSYGHPDVIVLRKFRDNILSKSIMGRFLIDCYYNLSPFWAKKLRNKPLISKFIKTFFLKPIVKRLK